MNLKVNTQVLITTVFDGFVAVSIFMLSWTILFQFAIFLGADNIHGYEVMLAFLLSIFASYYGTGTVSRCIKSGLRALIGKNRIDPRT